MRKILISVLALVFCSFISNAYSEDTKKYEEIDIEKHHHFDIGVGGYSFQLRYGYDLTPYNQIGFKTGIGTGLFNSRHNLQKLKVLCSLNLVSVLTLY